MRLLFTSSTGYHPSLSIQQAELHPSDQEREEGEIFYSQTFGKRGSEKSWFGRNQWATESAERRPFDSLGGTQKGKLRSKEEERGSSNKPV